MNKKHTITLTEDQISLLIMGLRYLELNHPYPPALEDYKPAFRKMLNEIVSQIMQVSMFDKAD